jgi:hypothetical protein
MASVADALRATLGGKIYGLRVRPEFTCPVLVTRVEHLNVFIWLAESRGTTWAVLIRGSPMGFWARMVPGTEIAEKDWVTVGLRILDYVSTGGSPQTYTE